MKVIESCKVCRYYRVEMVDGSLVLGSCRKNSPVGIWTPKEFVVESKFYNWPTVEADEWCGDFVEKIEG